jgi:hypothetical protein
MAKIYVLSQGRRCIPNNCSLSNYDGRHVLRVYDSEEKVKEHIRKNVKSRVDLLADRFEEFPDIDDIGEYRVLVYARNYGNYTVTELYYYYQSYDVE